MVEHAKYGMETISRIEARAMGFTRYYTSIPCSRGHISPRLVSNATCVACAKAKKGEEGSRALAAEAVRLRRARDPEVFRSQERERRAKNPDVFRAQDRARWVGGKADRQAEWLKADRAARPWIYAERARRRKMAVRRATPEWLTKEQRGEIITFYKEAHRMSQETGVKHHVDHIVPLNGVGVCGLHVPWNLQVITAMDNLKKGNRV